MQQMEHAPTLNWARLKWFDNLKWQSLSSDPSHREKQMKAVSWYADALGAPNFTNLPKTAIYTAGCDPLRDEGETYARKLVEAGNEVVQKRFLGVPHPFMHMDLCKIPPSHDDSFAPDIVTDMLLALWQANEFIEQTAAQIKVALHE